MPSWAVVAKITPPNDHDITIFLYVWDICRKWNLRNKLMFLNWDIGPYFGIFLCRNSCFLIGILVRTSESFYADILKYPVRKKAFCRKIFAWTSW
jgi:hypothetical protein